MNDEQLIALLRAIYILATVPYPFPVDASPRLAHALGQILAIANWGLSGMEPDKEVGTKP